MNKDILVNSDSETAVQTVTAILTQQGCHVIRSFDLRSALATQPAHLCPCHRTVPCTCQFIVLLVYAGAGEPAAIVVHSHDTETSLRLVADPAARPNSDLAMQVTAAMIETALIQGVTTDDR